MDRRSVGHHDQVITPVISPLINIGWQHLLYRAVLSLHHTITLWVVRGSSSLVRTEGFTQMLKQMRLKLSTLTSMNGQWDSKPTDEFRKKFIPYSLGCTINKAVCLCILCVVIFNHHYVLIAIVRPRQRTQNVDGDPFERHAHIHMLHRKFSPSRTWFPSCTHVTLSTPPGNIVGPFWPVHVTLYVC